MGRKKEMGGMEGTNKTLTNRRTVKRRKKGL